MDSLKKVMTLANVLRILYTVLYILCIVGAAICVLCGVMFVALEGTGLLEDPEFLSMIGDFEGLTGVEFPSLQMIMFGAAIVCVSMVVVYVFAARFYKHLQTVGDPFDRGVICKMQTLGIVYIVVPILGNTLSTLLFSGFTKFNLSVENNAQLTMGIVYLLLTIVFSYAADARDKAAVTETEELPTEAPATEDPPVDDL